MYDLHGTYHNLQDTFGEYVYKHCQFLELVYKHCELRDHIPLSGVRAIVNAR